MQDCNPGGLCGLTDSTLLLQTTIRYSNFVLNLLIFPVSRRLRCMYEIANITRYTVIIFRLILYNFFGFYCKDFNFVVDT